MIWTVSNRSETSKSRWSRFKIKPFDHLFYIICKSILNLNSVKFKFNENWSIFDSYSMTLGRVTSDQKLFLSVPEEKSTVAANKNKTHCLMTATDWKFRKSFCAFYNIYNKIICWMATWYRQWSGYYHQKCCLVRTARVRCWKGCCTPAYTTVNRLQSMNSLCWSMHSVIQRIFCCSLLGQELQQRIQ